MDPDIPVLDRQRSIPTLIAGGVTVVGLILATISTNLALAAGEQPVTLLPTDAGGGSLVAITVFRTLVTIALLAVLRWLRPRQLTASLAVTGLFYIALSAWQTWLMLART